jgi:hypothetical protein
MVKYQIKAREINHISLGHSLEGIAGQYTSDRNYFILITLFFTRGRTIDGEANLSGTSNQSKLLSVCSSLLSLQFTL